MGEREGKGRRTRSDLGGGVSAGSATLLLDVEGAEAATTAESVGLDVSLTKTVGTFGLGSRKQERGEYGHFGEGKGATMGALEGRSTTMEDEDVP